MILYNYFMINIFKKLLDLIYDKNCYFCHRSVESSVFCSKCYEKIEYLSSEQPSVLGKKLFAVALYSDIIQKLIRAVKYHDKLELADYQAKIMFEYWSKNSASDKKYTVIPVPMFYSKARKRKQNHMDLVGKKFCDLSGYTFDNKSLIRNRETAPQYKLTKSERENNLKGAFSLVSKNIKEPILLIDDISTTGTTLREIIKELQKNGFEDITCFVTAIPEKPSNYLY